MVWPISPALHLLAFLGSRMLSLSASLPKITHTVARNHRYRYIRPRHPYIARESHENYQKTARLYMNAAPQSQLACLRRNGRCLTLRIRTAGFKTN